jgi:hypothetical protein
MDSIINSVSKSGTPGPGSNATNAIPDITFPDNGKLNELIQLPVSKNHNIQTAARR